MTCKKLKYACKKKYIENFPKLSSLETAVRRGDDLIVDVAKASTRNLVASVSASPAFIRASASTKNLMITMASRVEGIIKGTVSANIASSVSVSLAKNASIAVSKTASISILARAGKLVSDAGSSFASLVKSNPRLTKLGLTAGAIGIYAASTGQTFGGAINTLENMAADALANAVGQVGRLVYIVAEEAAPTLILAGATAGEAAGAAAGGVAAGVAEGLGLGELSTPLMIIGGLIFFIMIFKMLKS